MSGFPGNYEEEKSYLFGFTCSKETLAEIIEALTVVHEAIEDD
jgi:hypothetical protein